MVDGIPEGKGTQYFITGNKYVGEFRAGKFSGEGKLLTNNETVIYEGTFRNGLLNGHGKYYETNSTKSYEGDFLDGKETGKGVSIARNGDKYEGEFLNGKRHGHGKLTE
jgi:hypothetical protein